MSRASSEMHESPGRYASPAEARQAPREEVVYVACIYEGSNVQKPDFIAVVDVDPDSGSYGEVVHRLDMPNQGGWTPSPLTPQAA